MTQNYKVGSGFKINGKIRPRVFGFIKRNEDACFAIVTEDGNTVFIELTDHQVALCIEDMSRYIADRIVKEETEIKRS